MMDPVLKSALNMGVSIVKIVVTLQRFSTNALLLLDNVKFDAATEIYVMKVTLGRRYQYKYVIWCLRSY